MGNTASTIASAIGSWVGGIAAHLVALIIAPIINQVRQQPPSPHPPPPHPLEAQMVRLVQSVDGLSEQVERLRVDLAARQEPFVYETAIPALPWVRRLPRGHADDAV